MSASPRVTSFSEDSLREWFSQYDEDGTGLMDETALGQLCEQLGLDPRSAPDIMKELDTNRDGKITFDDVLSKFGSHIHGDGQGDLHSAMEEGPSVLQDTQQFFTPQGKGAGSRAGSTIEQTAESTPVRSSLIFKKQRFGRWSISGSTPSSVLRRVPTPEGEGEGEGEDRDIQFLSPIPSSPPNSSRPGSNQDNYPDLTSMMSSFVAHTSSHGHRRRGSQVSSDEENLWEDSGSIYSSAVAANTLGVPPSEAWGADPGTPHPVSKDRSQSVPAAPNMSTPRQSLLPFGGGHFGPLNGLRQLVSPRSHKEEYFSIPLEEVLEELDGAGVVGEEGYTTERVLQELDLVSDGSVNLRNLASSMDQYLTTPTADKGPVSSVMRQIAVKAYRNELQLLRNQISVLNIEKDTLQFNVSRMMDDKDKMASQVDTDHDEMHQRTAKMLMDKELKYEERMKEVEKSFQMEMEAMRESAKNTMVGLEEDNTRLRNEEERMKEELKHDRIEVERLHNELDRTRHELEAKEHQITSLLRETSSQLDVVHLLEENETLKMKIGELEKGNTRQQIVELEEQCKDFKDRNDMLQSDLEKTLEELKKYRRKAQILRKKEKQLREEHQRLLEAGRTASGPSPDVVQQASHPPLPSTSSVEEEEVESEDVEEFEDDEGVERTEDTLSEGEEKSLHGELHELELRAAKKKIAKLENAKTKLSCVIERLQTECRAHTEKGESLRSKLEGKLQECEEFQTHLANLEAKLDSANALQSQLEVVLQQKSLDLLEAQEALETERERCSAMEEDHQLQLASLSDKLTESKGVYEELVNALKLDLGNLGRENVVLEQECSKLRKQVAEQQDKVAEHEQNFKEMTTKISQWMTESQAGRSQVEQDAAERLRQAMESLEQEQALHSAAKESFAEERRSLQSQLGPAQKQCEDLTSACVELQRKVDRLMAEVSQLKEQLEFVSQDKEEAAEQHFAEVDRLKALLDAATILQSENGKQMQQLHSLSDQLSTAHRRLAEVQEEHRVEVQALQEEVDRLQGDLVAAETRAGEVQQRFAALEGELDAVRQLKEDEVGELDARVAELEGIVEARETELSLSQRENVELEQSLGELEANQETQIHAMEASVSKLSARVEELEAEVESGNARLSSLLGVQTELREARVERDRLQGELAALKDRVATVDELHQKQLLDKQSSFAADLKGHRAELQREREHLQGQVTQTSTALEEARSRLEQAESGRNECQVKLSMMKLELEEVCSKMAALSEQHKMEVDKLMREQGHLEQDLRQAQGEVSSLQAQHKAALEELRKEEQRIRETMSQGWSAEKDSLQHEISELQSNLDGAQKRVSELDARLTEESARYSSLMEVNTSSLTEKERVFAEKVVSMQQEVDDLTSTVKGQQAELVELQSLLEDERQKKDAALLVAGEELASAREACRESELKLVSSEQQRESREAELRQQLTAMEASLSVQVKNIEDQFSERIAGLQRDLESSEKLLSEKSKALQELLRSGSVKEEEWHKTMDVLGQQVDRLTVEVKEQSSYVTQLRVTLAEQVEEKGRIQAELDHLRLSAAGRESEHDEVVKLKRQMGEMEAEFHEELRKKQSMLHTMELTLNAKEDLLSESCDSVFSLRAQVEDLQGRFTPEPVEMESTDGPGQWTTSEVERLSTELKHERRRSVDLQVQVVELKHMMEEEQEEGVSQVTPVQTKGEGSAGEIVTELQKKLSASEVTISELSCDLESFKNALLERDEGYEERLKGYSEKAAELDEYVEHLRSQMQATAVQVDELTEHNLLLEEENHSLREALERLQDSHLALQEESDSLARERDQEISQLREELSTAEFSLAEGSLYSPTDVQQLEEEVGQLQEQLRAEKARVVQPRRGRGHVESVDGGHLSLSDTKLEKMRVEHERALRDLQEQVTQLKGELQQLHSTLNRKSANLDDSAGYIERLNQQLRLVELEKEQLRGALMRQHQEEVDRLVRQHGVEMDRATQERSKLEDLRRQQEPLILQLMEQTTALDEDKTRLSRTLRELREEKEGHLKLIEELAVKACQ